VVATGEQKKRERADRSRTRHLPGARVTGPAAGLHAIVRLGREVDGAVLEKAARRRSLAVYPLGSCFLQPRPVHDGVLLGYANLTEPAIEHWIGRLAAALRESGAGPAG
jgi:GntR family transcriptional regulator / MocR family aminotransferase